MSDKAILYCVTPPDERQLKGIAAFLERKYGERIPVDVIKDPSVVGGFRLEYGDNVFLVFGRESRGLPESLLHENYANALRIPMLSDTRSLNLSNSVAIAVYEVLRQKKFDGMNRAGRLREYDD